MMMFLKAFEGHIYAALRIVTGFLMLFHGIQKLAPQLIGMAQQDMPNFVRYIAGPIELFGGLLVMLGLFTRPAAFLTSGQMAAAYFIGHASRGLLPIQNSGDLAVVYCFVFLFISARGPGKWALDRS